MGWPRALSSPRARCRAPTSHSPTCSAPTGSSRVAVGGEGTLSELFTSGTTGAPKAVPIPLRAVAGMHAYHDYGALPEMECR